MGSGRSAILGNGASPLAAKPRSMIHLSIPVLASTHGSRGCWAGGRSQSVEQRQSIEQTINYSYCTETLLLLPLESSRTSITSQHRQSSSSHQPAIMFAQATRTLFRASPALCSRTLRTPTMVAPFSTQSSLVARGCVLSLARPSATQISFPWAAQTRGMKVRSSVKKLCDGCKVRKEANPKRIKRGPRERGTEATKDSSSSSSSGQQENEQCRR